MQPHQTVQGPWCQYFRGVPNPCSLEGIQSYLEIRIMIQESPDRGTKVLLRLCHSTPFPLPHFPWGHHKLFEYKSLPVVCFWVIQPRHGFSEPEINAHVKRRVLAIFITVIILEFLIWNGLPRSFPLVLGLQCKTQKPGEDMSFAQVT